MLKRKLFALAIATIALGFTTEAAAQGGNPNVKQGTILSEQTTNGTGHVYLIEESLTKKVYLSIPFQAILNAGTQVDFFRLQQSVNTMSQTNNMVANMQKARHDAMMATIQNTR